MNNIDVNFLTDFYYVKGEEDGSKKMETFKLDLFDTTFRVEKKAARRIVGIKIPFIYKRNFLVDYEKIDNRKAFVCEYEDYVIDKIDGEFRLFKDEDNKNNKNYLFLDNGEVIINYSFSDKIEEVRQVSDWRFDTLLEGDINNIIFFLGLALKKRNPYLYEALTDHLKQVSQRNKMVGMSYLSNSLALYNLNNMTLNNTEGFEKVVKINKDLVFENFNKEKLAINNDGKINKVLEMPKFVIDYLNEKKYPEMLSFLQDITIDGNEFRILIDFLENSKTIVPAQKREEVFTSFVKELAEIYSYKEYKIKDLLNFLIRESYFNKPDPGVRQKVNVFNFPLEEARLLKDYLRICDNNKLKALKYPNIKLDHDVAMKNINSLRSIKEDDFIEKVNKYKYMADEFKNDKYEIITPDSLNSMIQEGNNLHHCVASYAHAVSKGESKIFFLREKTDVNKSFVTIEVDKANQLNHIRGVYNIVPDDKIINMVKRWLKNID